MEEEKEDEDEEREEILKEDPVAKWQFAYNENNMYAIEMPESTATNEDKRNDVFFATGEKKIPKGFVQVFLRHMWHICQNTAYAVLIWPHVWLWLWMWSSFKIMCCCGCSCGQNLTAMCGCGCGCGDFLKSFVVVVVVVVIF